MSTQRLAPVDLAVRTKLLVDSVDAYVLAMPSPVNRQKRCLHPVVRERQSLVGQLQSILRDLGLERRTREMDVAAALAALHPRPKGDAAKVDADAAPRTSGVRAQLPGSPSYSLAQARLHAGQRLRAPSTPRARIEAAVAGELRNLDEQVLSERAADHPVLHLDEPLVDARGAMPCRSS